MGRAKQVVAWTLSGFTLVGGPVLSVIVGAEFGAWAGIGAGAVTAVATAGLIVCARRARERARRCVNAAAPTMAEVKFMLSGSGGCRAWLVRADGLPLGAYWVRPPPDLARLVRMGTRLMVRWHPDFPELIEVDWSEAAARAGATLPAIARIVQVMDSQWANPGAAFLVRLLRSDGAPLGDHWLSPPPHLADMVEPETRLVVKWHPDFPNVVDVDWSGSMALVERSGYR